MNLAYISHVNRADPPVLFIHDVYYIIQGVPRGKVSILELIVSAILSKNCIVHVSYSYLPACLSIYLYIYLWFYSYFLDLGRFFIFVILHTVGGGYAVA
jgi:hypothetical protein